MRRVKDVLSHFPLPHEATDRTDHKGHQVCYFWAVGFGPTLLPQAFNTRIQLGTPLQIGFHKQDSEGPPQRSVI